MANGSADADGTELQGFIEQCRSSSDAEEALRLEKVISGFSSQGSAANQQADEVLAGCGTFIVRLDRNPVVSPGAYRMTSDLWMRVDDVLRPRGVPCATGDPPPNVATPAP